MQGAEKVPGAGESYEQEEQEVCVPEKQQAKKRHRSQTREAAGIHISGAPCTMVRTLVFKDE
jgi:hypothetical protein